MYILGAGMDPIATQFRDNRGSVDAANLQAAELQLKRRKMEADLKQAFGLQDLDAIMPAVQAMHNNMLVLGITPDEVASLRRLQRPLKEALASLRAAVEARLRAELAQRSAAKLAVVHEAASALQTAIAGTRP
jgi:hypothetical protein